MCTRKSYLLYLADTLTRSYLQEIDGDNDDRKRTYKFRGQTVIQR